MSKGNKQLPIETLLGEVQSIFVEIEELQLKELNQQIQEIKDVFNRGYKAIESLHESLFIYKSSSK